MKAISETFEFLVSLHENLENAMEELRKIERGVPDHSFLIMRRARGHNGRLIKWYVFGQSHAFGFAEEMVKALRKAKDGYQYKIVADRKTE